MDGNKYAVIWEIIKNVLGVSIIFLLGDWFGAGKFFSVINYALLEYFAVSTFVAIWLAQEKKEQQQFTATV
jgi:hypothetical protein